MEPMLAMAFHSQQEGVERHGMVTSVEQALKHLHKQGVRLPRPATSGLGSGSGLLVSLALPQAETADPHHPSGCRQSAFQARGRPWDLTELLRTGM